MKNNVYHISIPVMRNNVFGFEFTTSTSEPTEDWRRAHAFIYGQRNHESVWPNFTTKSINALIERCSIDQKNYEDINERKMHVNAIRAEIAELKEMGCTDIHPAVQRLTSLIPRYA